MSAGSVEQLVRQIYGLSAMQREMSRHALAELGSQGFTALGVVHVHGPLRVSEVAHRLAVDLSVASRQVAALERAGYVQREADAEDRRAQLVSATDDGRRVLKESHRRMVHAAGRALEGWSDAEVTALAEGLARLRADHARLTESREAVR